ncbi:hypothetical protein [Deinococcus planocerae]|uniref:hypothetical protein n=1 Tax=Deinococcus planocerae TaxID=1737569 RepID=UPI000C7EA41D|nr:hypothetical protein [Deinococcus planocerae]
MLKNVLVSRGLDPLTASLTASLFVDAIPAVTLYLVGKKAEGADIRGREALEAERLLEFLRLVGRAVQNNALPLWKIRQVMEEMPALIDTFDCIIRSVEAETIRAKLHHHARLARTVIATETRMSRSEEYQHYSRSLLDLMPFEL